MTLLCGLLVLAALACGSLAAAELLDKDRMLAITKSDMLDDELMEHLSEEITEKKGIDIPYIFISSVSGYNIPQLKDKLFEMINKTI